MNPSTLIRLKTPEEIARIRRAVVAFRDTFGTGEGLVEAPVADINGDGGTN